VCPKEQSLATTTTQLNKKVMPQKCFILDANQIHFLISKNSAIQNVSAAQPKTNLYHTLSNLT